MKIQKSFFTLICLILIQTSPTAAQTPYYLIGSFFTDTTPTQNCIDLGFNSSADYRTIIIQGTVSLNSRLQLLAGAGFQNAFPSPAERALFGARYRLNSHFSMGTLIGSRLEVANENSDQLSFFCAFRQAFSSRFVLSAHLGINMAQRGNDAGLFFWGIGTIFPVTNTFHLISEAALAPDEDAVYLGAGYSLFRTFQIRGGMQIVQNRDSRIRLGGLFSF